MGLPEISAIAGNNVRSYRAVHPGTLLCLYLTPQSAGIFVFNPKPSEVEPHMPELAQISEDQRKTAIEQAVKLVTKSKPTKVISSIAVLMLENSRLLAECNRLREKTGEQLLPAFKQ
jgi:hypothetical protein